MDEDHAITRARGGNLDALTELLEGHAPTLRSAVTGKIPAHLQSLLSEEDVLQQTYTDAFLGIGRFVPVGDGAFAAWLRRMARNNLLDGIRMLEAAKRGGGRPGAQESGSGSTSSFDGLYESILAETNASPTRTAARSEAADTLRKAVGRLPDAYRTIVQAYDLEGKAMAEVARTLGRSEGAAWLGRHRALRRLAELLGSSAGFFSDAP